METFPALLPLCAGNSPVTGEFPSQRPVTRSFDVSFDLRLNKQLSKPSRRRWFETPSRSLWRHCNENGWHLQTTFSKAFCCLMNHITFWFKFHWKMFVWVQLAMKLVLAQSMTWRRTGGNAISHCLNLWWLKSLTPYDVSGPHWFDSMDVHEGKNLKYHVWKNTATETSHYTHAIIITNLRIVLANGVLTDLIDRNSKCFPIGSCVSRYISFD